MRESILTRPQIQYDAGENTDILTGLRKGRQQILSTLVQRRGRKRVYDYRESSVPLGGMFAFEEYLRPELALIHTSQRAFVIGECRGNLRCF